MNFASRTNTVHTLIVKTRATRLDRARDKGQLVPVTRVQRRQLDPTASQLLSTFHLDGNILIGFSSAETKLERSCTK